MLQNFGIFSKTTITAFNLLFYTDSNSDGLSTFESYKVAASFSVSQSEKQSSKATQPVFFIFFIFIPR